MNIFQKGTLVLREAEIIDLIRNKTTLDRFLENLFQTLENGFVNFAAKQFVNPPRHEFYFTKGSVEAMSASDQEYFSCKIVNTHKDNPTQYDLPTIIANGILVDGKTGYPLMITGSSILTALRTGVASAIATKYLANRDSKQIGIIGNGAQAIPQLHAISFVRDIESVYLFDTDISASKSMSKSARKFMKDLNISIESDIEKLCQKSEIIVTATCKEHNTLPVVRHHWVKQGTHINAVGGDSPGKIEIEQKLLQKSKIVVDFQDQAVYEGESQQVLEDGIYSDLAEVVAGKKKGRETRDEITVFDSVGFAMEDLQVYKMIYEMAIKEGVGTFMNITSKPDNCKNLYKSFFNL
ncbi:MAG: hypothetical protein AB7V56_15195 [Candidatus Nitrosocosmicus sp.]|uniref:hypothetical protein n=1 Tax=Candidatus Nitrosocosmicus agrestis TaxID=2563600 RepID=UPI00122E8802|nr:hypothetical protein [Candidatus Nitrosocosmicus sp. SS]KAA2280645.1 hypothetical protein F1Z66_10170 [Candidatus Nitrosocosmicus sp. SS]KAF0869372.1 hypothetical protein E5N71_05745 [Candidatus Nitrosocosmicus sp. SS]MDR4492707.1 hypothetical protein [Candidatus Nitrosocosmicus sp.]